MMDARPWRQRALFAAVAVTIALALASGKERRTQASPVLPSAHHGARKHESAAPPVLSVELERLRAAGAAHAEPPAGDAFRPTSWYVPPPPPPPLPPPKPPAPTAPPLPFTFMGRYEEGAKKVILLVKGDRIYTVSEGEVIDNTYRVGHLTEGGLDLTYLPLNIKQTLATGGT
ncbi:MAG: hypothetical protein ACM3KD_09195 [Hyphomicrobiaceae bacterium]